MKAQIKMFETIAILVIFFILLLFGFMFYTRIQKSSFEAEKEQAITLRAIEIAEQISFLPEIQCSTDNNPRENCIDFLKFNASTETINSNRQSYFPIFGFSAISLEIVYSESGLVNPPILYDFPKKEDQGKIRTQFPIEIYDPIKDANSYGVLYVDVYR